MAHGWQTHKGVRTFCQGNELMLCGPSCVVMAIKWVTDDEFDAKSISSTGRQKSMPLKFNPANINNPAMVRVMPSLSSDDYGSLSGMGPDEVRASLIDHSLSANIAYPGGAGVFTYSELRNALNKANKSTPVIIQLNSPSHFVICRERAKGIFGGKNKYSIADPADGRMHTGAHVSGNKIIFSSYNSTIQSIISVTGKITQSRVRVF
ncbi:hypothetical protein SAMN02745866_01714 [Alteromonadaceae bacterium Bs31]|nr:hypothetical protein SAMN02745866_01714 [Alteromonadaceae bacterium Bs31]